MERFLSALDRVSYTQCLLGELRNPLVVGHPNPFRLDRVRPSHFGEEAQADHVLRSDGEEVGFLHECPYEPCSDGSRQCLFEWLGRHCSSHSQGAPIVSFSIFGSSRISCSLRGTPNVSYVGSAAFVRRVERAGSHASSWPSRALSIVKTI